MIPAERPVGEKVEEVPEWDAREGGTLDALAQVVLLELQHLADQLRQRLGRRGVRHDVLKKKK